MSYIKINELTVTFDRFKEDHKNQKVEIVFTETNNMKFSYMGKHWNPSTMCQIFIVENNGNRLLNGSGTVVKHEKDTYNYNIAQRLALKKALEADNGYCFRKNERKQIWQFIKQQDITFQYENTKQTTKAKH